MDCFELLDQILLQPYLQGRPHLQRGGTKGKKTSISFVFYILPEDLSPSTTTPYNYIFSLYLCDFSRERLPGGGQPLFIMLSCWGKCVSQPNSQ